MTRGTPRRYRTAAGTARRQPRVRRASAGLSPTRAAAILAMLIAAGAIYGLSATAAFGFDHLDVRGTHLTSTEAIQATIGLAPGTNLVGLATDPIASRVRQLPSVSDVDVSVALPDSLVVDVTERRPIVVWAYGKRRWAVDETGVLFAELGPDPDPATDSLPVVTDERLTSAGLAVPVHLDPVILDAATRLASLTPSQIGSHAAGLQVTITDDRGFTVSSGKNGWLAVFGFYLRSQRTPALVPGQVQLLGALLAGREDTVETVILADDREGTMIPKPTPRPTKTPKP
jgi:cell division septal protein FtsQ